jgi:murein L,D-transpeptidase YcbB/YkuD
MATCAGILGLFVPLFLQEPARVSAPMAVDTAAAAEAVQAELMHRVELLRASGALIAAGERIRLPTAVAGIYEAVAFEPLWNERSAADLRMALAELTEDGLRPEHYHVASIGPSADSTAVGVAQRDLLRTDALLVAARDLRLGRAAPDAPDAASTTVSEATGLPADVFAAAIRSGAPGESLRRLRPSHFAYRGLVEGLADLRRLEAAGGWDPVAAGPPMRAGLPDPRVPALRRRLALSGDLGAAQGARGDSLFDVALEAAVRRFQHLHGLAEDGVVGRATQAELDVTVQARIRQVRVNLERARWVLHDLPDTAVVVNIAGGMVYLLRGRDVVWESRAIVGTPYTRTPVFTAQLRYVELNPSWTVPPGIVGEIIARIREEPGYLAREGIRVLDRAGRPVDAASIDFDAWTARTFPYVFRQEPGPRNPLGRLKFGLPNPHAVYLHDTPERDLFARDRRAFSHGCVRVDDPVALAELVLSGTGWTRAAIEAAIKEGRTRVIGLPQPLPVVVEYWTAAADRHGELHYHADVYGRDAAVLERLDLP